MIVYVSVVNKHTILYYERRKTPLHLGTLLKIARGSEEILKNDAMLFVALLGEIVRVLESDIAPQYHFPTL